LDMRIEGYAEDIIEEFPLALAKQTCIELGDKCHAVICKYSKDYCTVHADAALRQYKGETAYVKRCRVPAKDAADGSCGSKPPESVAAPAVARTDPNVGSLPGKTAIVLLAHNRAEEVDRCLASLLAQPGIERYELAVSLDDATAYAAMKRLVERVAAQHGVRIAVWPLVEKVIPDPNKHNDELRKWLDYNTAKIAHHYWSAFERAFQDYNFESAIFVEEDLIFAPDFLALFRSSHWLLDHDPSLWCISAWNDFGYTHVTGDSCRLQRTSYFPGLGFMIQNEVWKRLREEWPTAPTMGWDYWMRVAFRRAGKECVVPEISRSHHNSARGSSISTSKQVRLLSLMALAQIPSICGASGPCHQFGDISYLASDTYEVWMQSTIDKAQKLSSPALLAGATQQKADIVYVLPFTHEDSRKLVEKLIMPSKVKGAIPADLRSEHYGVVVTRSKARSLLLLVDKRSPRGYLGAASLRLREDCESVAGAQGESCKNACASKGTVCDASQMYFFNNCATLEKHFGCEAGCAHQVGKELPVYVPDDFQPTYRQCLVSFISPMTCDAKHASTSRVCACCHSR